MSHFTRIISTLMTIWTVIKVPPLAPSKLINSGLCLTLEIKSGLRTRCGKKSCNFQNHKVMKWAFALSRLQCTRSADWSKLGALWRHTNIPSMATNTPSLWTLSRPTLLPYRETVLSVQNSTWYLAHKNYSGRNPGTKSVLSDIRDKELIASITESRHGFTSTW
jgi:hypothetical protein